MAKYTLRLAEEYEHVRYEDVVSKNQNILRRMNQWIIESRIIRINQDLC